MLRTLLGVSVLLSMSACKYDQSGVFIAYIPLADDLVCDTTISENITDSDPPDDTTTTVSDWVFTETATQSDAIVLIQIFEDKGGNVLVDVGGTIYPGTRDGKVITAMWDNTNDSTETAENGVAGYRYSEADNSKVNNTITFTKNSEIKGYTVDWKTSTSTVFRAEETDEWDSAEGPYSGDINTWIFTYLEGTGSNSPDQVDCDAADCFVDVTQNCNGSLSFEAIETSLDHEDFDAVDGDGQPNGIW